jgi:hypothetical protein
MEARARPVIRSRTAPGFAPSVVYATISQPRGFSGARGLAKRAEHTSDPEGHAEELLPASRFHTIHRCVEGYRKGLQRCMSGALMLIKKRRNRATGDDMETRRQVYDLTLVDMKRSPVWEFALDEEGKEGQDEATVRPYRFAPPLNPNDGMFIVQADFALADGTLMEGYLTPPAQGVGDIRTFQPVIITEQGQVVFWYGILEPDTETVSQNYRVLGKNAPQVFPIRFRSAVEILGGPIEGDLQGFLYCKMDLSHALGLDDLPLEVVR